MSEYLDKIHLEAVKEFLENPMKCPSEFNNTPLLKGFWDLLYNEAIKENDNAK